MVAIAANRCVAQKLHSAACSGRADRIDRVAQIVERVARSYRRAIERMMRLEERRAKATTNNADAIASFALCKRGRYRSAGAYFRELGDRAAAETLRLTPRSARHGQRVAAIAKLLVHCTAVLDHVEAQHA